MTTNPDRIGLVGLDIICVLHRTQRSDYCDERQETDFLKVTSVLETKDGLLSGTFESMHHVEDSIVSSVFASGERTPPRSLTSQKDAAAVVSTPETLDSTFANDDDDDDEVTSIVSDLTSVAKESSPFMDFIDSVDKMISKMENEDEEASSPDLVQLRKHSQSSNDDNSSLSQKRNNGPPTKEKKLDDSDYLVPVADFTQKKKMIVNTNICAATRTTKRRTTRRERYRQTLRKRRNRRRIFCTVFFFIIIYYRQTVVSFLCHMIVSLHWHLELISGQDVVSKNRWPELMDINNLEEERKITYDEENYITITKPIGSSEEGKRKFNRSTCDAPHSFLLDRGCRKTIDSEFDVESFVDSMMQ